MFGFLLADANAKLGSVQSHFVGGHQLDPQSPTGELLHELLAEQDLAIPATFASRGEGWTKQSNSDRRDRIDYVACPVAWLPAVVFAEVPSGISLALEDREDHRAAMVEFAVEAGPPLAVQVPCTAADFMRHINRQALRMEGVAAQLQEKWSMVPELPPSWPADLAEWALGSLTRRFMLQVCPKDRPAPRRDWISESTWVLLRRHAAARRASPMNGMEEKCAALPVGR